MSDGPRTLGRYAIAKEIAAGGMARVHIGQLRGPAGFTRTVAIKRMHAHLASDPDFTAMFLDEARLATRVRHPNVVPTLDVVQGKGELWLVLEYVHGESLATLLRAVRAAREAIPLPVVASIASHVLHGLHAAHTARDERGEPLHMVHRDVSPQNVVVGADGVVRVVDFGIAKARGRAQVSHAGDVKGKIAYMAPEQLAGMPVDARSDLYAVGVVLWEALTGRRLFEDEADAVRFCASTTEIPRPSSETPLPDALERVVVRALSRAPEARFSDAHAMALAVEAAVQPAVASVVAAWIERVAGDALCARARLVAEVEASTSGADQGAPVDEDPLGEAPTRARSMSSGSDAPAVGVPLAPRAPATGRFGVLAGVVVAGVALALFAGRGAHDRAPPATTAAIDAAAPAVAASARSEASSATSIAPAESSLATTAAPARAASARPAARPAPARAARPSCDPPYTIDADGIRHLRRECLREP